MKLCFLANAYSTHTKKWAEAMRDKGWNVDIISFEQTQISGVNVHYVKPLKREMSENPSDPKTLSYILKVREFKGILNEIKPDIVHAHYATGYGLTGALCGVHPYIISTWGSDVCVAPKKNKLYRKILEYNFRRADFVTATSHYLTHETSLYTNKNITTIPFGVNTEKFTSLRISDNSKITVGIVKSLEEVYGIRYLIDAFYKVSKTHSNINLLIVGDGSLRRQLEDYCQKLGIKERVTFTGRVQNDSIPDILGRIDIFVMPSLSESFGVSLLEAQACGIPVVATNVGGIPEVIQNEKTGFLVEPGNSGQIAEKLKVLVDNPVLRETMGKCGRNFVVKYYDWQGCVERMHGLYQGILNRNGR